MLYEESLKRAQSELPVMLLLPFSQGTDHAILGAKRGSFKNLARLTRHERKLERLEKA